MDTSPSFADLLKGAVQRTSSADQVADAMRALIFSGDLRQGEALREVPLAEALGVSRNTTREAFRVLSAEGIITQRLHKGASVRQLTADDIHDIFRVRRWLELSAADAFASAPSSDLEALRRAVARLRAACAVRDAHEIADADFHFHGGLIALLGSPRLSRFFAQLESELRLCFAIADYFEQDVDKIAREHEELFGYLERGESEAFRTRLDQVIRESEEQIIESQVVR
jgi:DNA-binding GntR family transcriptional regulator